MNRFYRTLVCVALLSAALLTLTGCHKRGILSKNKVARIMVDLYVCDSYAKAYAEVNLAADSILLYKHVFDKYNTTLEQYQNSLSYYLPDKKAYTAILQKASDIAKRESERLRNEKVVPGLKVKIPFPASFEEDNPLNNKWWERRLDGSGIVIVSFHDNLKEIQRNAEEEQRRRNELERKKQEMTPAQKAEQKRNEEKAARIRERFRKNMKEDGTVNLQMEKPELKK